MSTVTEHFLRNNGEIDRLFGELHAIAAPLDAAKCKSLVTIHGRLVRLLCPITRQNQSTRSFVSKYMHFHNSAVPIFDSVAFAALRTMLRWNDEMTLFELPSEADEGYCWYVMRFFALYMRLRDAALQPTVRHVDHYLLSIAGSSYSEASASDDVGVLHPGDPSKF